MSVELKKEAAAAALELVEEGMRLGIGTGSTADEFSKLLGAKVASGFKITGVPTSERTHALCTSMSIPLTTLEEMPELDMVVDGADEVDHQFQLIKGGGGALLREKIVANAAEKMIVIADDSKLVDTLGAFPLPIEVNPFGFKATWKAVEKACAGLGLEGPLNLRGGDEPFVTDGGHYIIDASFGHISDASALSDRLLNIPGVVEHGLFLGYADVVILAGEKGVRQL
ncbi:MAG: ribose-5-phosphate isomerase RpiA [Rhizobiaceae bacterium]|nr:ribose-5-phosphate isomerase RpiA [Rhizobiaceae bacterium]